MTTMVPIERLKASARDFLDWAGRREVIPGSDLSGLVDEVRLALKAVDREGASAPAPAANQNAPRLEYPWQRIEVVAPLERDMIYCHPVANGRFGVGLAVFLDGDPIDASRGANLGLATHAVTISDLKLRSLLR